MARSTPKRKRSPIGSLIELVLTIAVAVGLALLIQAFVVKPYRIPSGSMEPTLDIGQRILANRLSTHPGIGDVVVFHPPAGADPEVPVCGNPSQGADHPQACDQPTKAESSQTFIKRVVGLPGDRISIVDGHVYRNGKREKDSYINPCVQGGNCNFRPPITVPAGDYYMMGDNRGFSDDSRFWGPVPQKWIIGEAFFTYWPPTGSARSSDAGRAGAGGPRRRGHRRPGRKLLSFDRGLGVRFVAGADEAGRGCLAGPLVAAAVLLDLERIGPAQARALGALNDSKQQTPEGRAELYPVIMRLAARVSIVSRCAPGIDARGLHRTNLAALRDALANVAFPGCLCLSDGFPVAGLGPDYQQRAVIGGDAKSAAIAAASVLAKETRDRYMRRADVAHPGWEFAQHVGYSTPEHRQAIERLGVSPLHRMSFQSTAYQQLALG